MNYPLPPSIPRKPWPILRPGACRPLRFVSLCKCWAAKNTHWFGGKTVECTLTDECIACQRGIDVRWTGWIIGKSMVNEDRAICHLSAGAANDLVPILRERGSLLGAQIVLERKGEKRNGPVYARVEGQSEVDRPFTAAELEKIINVIFGIHKSKRPHVRED